MKRYCQVAVNTPFAGSILPYEEGEFAGALKPGQLVKVPLGKRHTEGCVLDVGLDESKLAGVSPEKIKPVSAPDDPTIHLSDDELQLYKWMSQYYHYPLGQLIFDFLPNSMKRPRALQFDQGEGKSFDFTLSDDQNHVVDTMTPKLDQGFSKWLLHGVTGSGKTVVYLNLIRSILAQGKSVLFLLPEINLTPQFIKTFIEHLDAPIYSYNSSVSPSDKYGLWRLLQEDKKPKVVVGVRSAIFLPVKELGLIIVDEEHDSSFKQEDRCSYNARDVAIKKASLHKIPVLLGSATPTLELFYQFTQDEKLKPFYFAMRKRIGEVTLPKITMVDMRRKDLTLEEKELWPFTFFSLSKIREALAKKEQVLVFVNRLGFAHYVQCRSCGHQFSCPNCSVNLKYFKKKGILDCNYCDYKIPLPELCPQCGNMSIVHKGFGTERLQEILQQELKGVRVERFDREEIKTFTQLEERLNAFHQGEIDILVGTQMLSKGHNFKKVNLVLVLGLDGQLNYPDFRANERVYQLLTQVSGRSGRFGKESEVLIHTLGPDNKVFAHVLRHSFDEFYEEEIPMRKICDCPPFTRVLMLYFTGRHQDKTIEVSSRASEALRSMAKKHFPQVEVLGPRPTMVEKRVNKFTWSIMLRSGELSELHGLVKSLKLNDELYKDVDLKIDVDPYHLF